MRRVEICCTIGWDLEVSPSSVETARQGGQGPVGGMVWKQTKRTLSDVNPEMAGEMRLALAEDCRVEDGIVFLEKISGPHYTLILPKEAIEEGTIPAEVLSHIVDKQVEDAMANFIDGIGEATEGASRLFPLRTRPDGHNCLLNAASLGLWGVQDRDLLLRCAVCDTMNHPKSGGRIRQRWEAESIRVSRHEGWEPTQEDLDKEWKEELDRIKAPDVSLSPVHVFALAQVLRRPIVVYAPPFVKGSEGDDLNPDGTAGIFLPLLWDPSDCHKVPLAMTFTFSPGNNCGHFSALVGVASKSGLRTKLSLMRDGIALPVKFLNGSAPGEVLDDGDRAALLDMYLDFVDSSGRARRASRGARGSPGTKVYAAVSTGESDENVGAKLFLAYERDMKLQKSIKFLSKAGAGFLAFLLLLACISLGSWVGGAGPMQVPIQLKQQAVGGTGRQKQQQQQYHRPSSRRGDL